MRILYIYERMPSTYQHYLLNLLITVKTSLKVKTLVYVDSIEADYVANTYGFKYYLQRILFSLKLSKQKRTDLSIFKKFDILHVQHSYLFRKIIPLLDSNKRPKIIITLRGGDTYIKPWVDEKWFEFYKNKGNLIDAYITVSQNQKEYLLNWGIKEDKIHVIPISFGDMSYSKPKYPNKDRLRIVSAFRMTWEKNIEGSIMFAKKLKDINVDFQYDIYGNGSDLGQLYYLIHKYDLSKNVSIKGKIENDRLKQELIKYDFFLQISISEALSASVIEAQSYGLPCIVSDSGGLPEAVIAGKTAIVCHYNDIEKMVKQCLEIWNNDENYYLYSKNAIQYANENFTLKHEEYKLKKLYKSLI